MSDAQVPQPISAVPLRWSGLTGRQLAWLGTATAGPMLLIHLHASAGSALVVSGPWLAGCALLGLGRREGRGLDAWVADWLRFQAQPHHLLHPGLGAEAHSQAFVSVDALEGTAATPLNRPSLGVGDG